MPLQNNYKILIPCYNGAKQLEKLIKILESKDLKDKILLVNDGSTDKTLEICQKEGVAHLSYPKNRGKGFALKKGIEKILTDQTNSFFITMDADLQHDPSSIADFVQKYQQTKADIIIGARNFKDKTMPFPRVLSNRITTFMVNLLAKQPTYDSQSGYRLISTKIIRELDLISDNYEFETELLLKAAFKGAKIEKVTIPTIYGDEKSSINHFKDTYRFVRLYLKMMIMGS